MNIEYQDRLGTETPRPEQLSVYPSTATPDNSVQISEAASQASRRRLIRGEETITRTSLVLQFQEVMRLVAAREDSIADQTTAVVTKSNKGGLWKKRKISDRAPRHADIDSLYPSVSHPPLSYEELNAFYVFSLATEPVVAVIFTALATVILQNMAAGAGKEVSDHAIPCNYTVSGYKCVTEIAGAWVDPSSFSLYTTAFSVLLQAIVFISLGALADHGSFRKRFMIGFMACAIISCMCMIAIRDSSLFLVTSAIVILAQLAFGASHCFYNSYIPVLSSVHWNVLTASPQARTQIYEATMNTVSSVSQIYGYCGAVGCFAVVGGCIFGLQTLPATSGFGDVGFFNSMGVSTYAMQVGVFVTAVWAAVGMYWPVRYIRERPYVALPKGTNYFTYSWVKLVDSFRHARKMPNTFLMLFAWFLLSDAITTVGSTTILFATQKLNFSTTEILILAIGAPLTAGGGNYLWLCLQRKYNISTKKMLIFLISLSVLLPIYGIIGLFAPLGLRAKWELFPAGIYYGALHGGIQSFSRVLFSELIPRGHEGEFFCLYSITDKGSSWFGPLIVGAITDSTHEIRYGFIFLFVMLCLPVFILQFVNVEKGRFDAEEFRAADLDAQFEIQNLKQNQEPV
ncbi:Autophagy protein 22 [Physocladia obscura]|uniref:Autophagy-related protein n=1 Tax=Physocladia obscura TaxID=109957 RepID=A0AAD5SX94_9FUNG|nr:Autophagy protein 22 [Physocladia obscura]